MEAATLLFVGHDGDQVLDSTTTQQQIDTLVALPSALVSDGGKAIPWKALNDPAKPRSLLQFVLSDRRRRVDEHAFVTDRPAIAVATVVHGAVVRFEFYQGHDALSKTHDLLCRVAGQGVARLDGVQPASP